MRADYRCSIFVLIACVVFQTNAAPLPTNGIAAKYPGDIGIERDDRVVFVENFDEDSLDAVWKRWETVSDKPGMSFSSDVPPGSRGKQSLVMDRRAGSGAQ